MKDKPFYDIFKSAREADIKRLMENFDPKVVKFILVDKAVAESEASNQERKTNDI